MYFMGSAEEVFVCARSGLQNRARDTQRAAITIGRLCRVGIRRAEESLCIYLSFCVKSTTLLDAVRLLETKPALGYLHKPIPQLLFAGLFFPPCAARFSLLFP